VSKRPAEGRVREVQDEGSVSAVQQGGKQNSEAVPHEELKKLSSSNQNLREEVSRLQGRLEEEEERKLVQTRKLRKEMRTVHSKHKKQLASMETTHKHKL